MAARSRSRRRRPPRDPHPSSHGSRGGRVRSRSVRRAPHVAGRRRATRGGAPTHRQRGALHRTRGPPSSTPPVLGSAACTTSTCEPGPPTCARYETRSLHAMSGRPTTVALRDGVLVAADLTPADAAALTLRKSQVSSWRTAVRPATLRSWRGPAASRRSSAPVPGSWMFRTAQLWHWTGRRRDRHRSDPDTLVTIKRAGGGPRAPGRRPAGLVRAGGDARRDDHPGGSECR